MVLKVDRVEKTFSGKVRVLAGVSFELSAGSSVALTGESGSGKSTLLNICAGLEPADAGRVTVSDAVINPAADRAAAHLRTRKIGLVFQNYNLIPSLTAGDNIAFQARLAGNFDAAWAGQLAARLGLGEVLDRYPENLSGGQQQRVAIGRALASRPPLILADEPTGNLDEAASDEVISLFLDLVADTNAALLMVTHSRLLAGRLARQLHLSGGQLV